ncbi:MAG: glycosyl transferase family 2 [Gemmatimonadetes bacterium]|nr:MAG: glycosyl transferase family 2 [Gemmatimonadota bacterium]
MGVMGNEEGVDRVQASDADNEGELAGLRELLGQMQARLAEEQATLVTLRAALEASRADLRGVHSSLSWRLTAPLRVVRDFVRGLFPFLREMRGFPRRARYTLAARGATALLADVTSELAARLRRGTLAALPPARPAAVAAATVPYAARGDEAARGPLHLSLAVEPRASIVIPAVNGFARTYACLASILERTGDVPYEVIVVDDASTDETRHLERVVTGVRVVRNAANCGFIEACNRGAEATRGEFLVFLNNDTFVSQGWLAQLLEPFGSSGEGEVGLVGAKLVYPDGRLQEAGGIVFADGSGWNYGRGDDPDNPKYQFRCDAHYCSGACIAIRRDLFRELGGFDPHYAPMYYEDVDLAFAVRAAGRRVVYQPTCLIVHFEGGTAGTDVGSGAKRYQRLNQQKFVAKWAKALAAQPPPDADPDVARYRPTGPHVLIIDAHTPRTDHDAGSVRMSHVCRILRRLGCHVTFLPENRAQDGDYTRALQAAGVEALYHPYVLSLERHLRQAGARYQAVIMSRVDVASQVIDAVRRHCPRAQRVFDTVDLHFLREARRAEVTGERHAAHAERLKAKELAVARACNVTLVVSPAERDLLAREAPDVAVDVLSLIVTADRTETPFAERSGILFIGNFQHPPNCDALEDYLRNIHPAVRERLPHVVFTVIGAHVPPHLERLGDDGVQFAGPVADIRPHFAAARLSVAPLRYGAGIKGKINTSLAFGVPVVTTTVGAEGMELHHADNILIADAPEAFAEAVVALHSDAALWTRLSANGLRAVTTQFSVANAERALARVLGLRGDAGSTTRASRL